MKRLILDLDDTICTTISGDYRNSKVIPGIVEKIIEYKSMGFSICISTSRNMRTFNGNVGKINSETLPIIMDWLKKNEVPYDEVYVGKPWCGTEGFYVDDKAIRPDEFIKYNYDEIKQIVGIKA